MIRRLLLVLVLLVAIVAVADFLLKSWVESRIQSSAHEHMEGVAAVRAQIDSYPFLPRLLATGEVSNITIDLTEIAGEPIDVGSIRLDVDGLRFDRTDLFLDSRATITGVDVVRITAVVEEDTIRAITGRDVQLRDGVVSVTIEGVDITAAIAIRDGRIEFDVNPLPAIGIPLPGADLLPCEVEGRVVADAIELECTTDRLPPRLVAAIGSIDLRDALD